MSKVVFLIGSPGSGKGTQADLLAKELGLYHFEISKVIEEETNSNLKLYFYAAIILLTIGIYIYIFKWKKKKRRY